MEQEYALYYKALVKLSSKTEHLKYYLLDLCVRLRFQTLPEDVKLSQHPDHSIAKSFKNTLQDCLCRAQSLFLLKTIAQFHTKSSKYMEVLTT